MRRPVIGIILAAAIAAPVPLAHADILVGAVGPLTGTNAYSGEQIERGAESAIADINSGGGILGQRLKLLVIDDACEADQAVAAAKKLAAAKAVFVVGHLCSSASIPAAEVYDKAGIIQITPAPTNPKLTEVGHTNVFRTCGRDDQQGTEAGDYLAARWPDAKIGILHDGSTYGAGLAEEMRKALNKRGVHEALFEPLTPGQTDYSAVLEKVRAASVTVVYYGGYYQEAALLVREASESGYRLQLVSGDALATDAFWQIAGPSGEGTLFTFFPDARSSAAAKPVVDQFRKQGFEPDGYTLYAYAAVQIWAQATAKAGSLEPQAVVAALHANEFDTVLGKISFDAKGDVKQPAFVWYVWQDGKYVVHERLKHTN